MKAKNKLKRKFNVLLVDDEVDLLDITKEAIEPYFGTVFTASSVAEAIAVLGHSGEVIDLVVCDFKMPNQDGLTLRNIILHEYPKMQFVMLTGYAYDSKIIEAQKKLNFPVIDKPTRPDVLIERLESLFITPDLNSSKEKSYLETLGEEDREAYAELSEVAKKKELKKFTIGNRNKVRRRQKAS